MSYIIVQRRSELITKQDDMLASKRWVIERKPEPVFFYELEAAVVLDVILDDTHPAFINKNLDPEDWPVDANGEKAKEGQPNYGWIGMIKFRFLNSQEKTVKEILGWAIPMENTGITEYPLMNEVVVIGKYLGNYYYGKKVNLKKQINTNANFLIERVAGHVDQNIDEYTKEPYTGPVSVLNGGPKDQVSNPNYVGNLGNYFKFNPAIRSLQRYEGDSIVESRFGSSIRFGAYDGNRDNDNGLGEYADNGGNPMILIRNRQEPVKGKSEPSKLINKGYTLENINEDGTSIHITSGKTVSLFKPTTTTPIIRGKKPLKLPKFDGEQLVMNSDRLIFSSKANEMLFYSKKAVGMSSDGPISFSCTDRMTLTSFKTVTINAPQIFLGDHAKIGEPALLGRSTVILLYSLCDWLLLNVNTQIQVVTTNLTHFHMTKIGPTLPPLPPAAVLWAEQLLSLQASQISLLALRAQLSSLMSSRVYVN